MVFRRLLSILSLLISVATCKSNATPNNSAVLRADADSKCHSYNTNYNYNYYNSPLTAGWNKKMEALLHRVLNELREMREEIKFFKGNKTIGTYKYINGNWISCCLFISSRKQEIEIISYSPSLENLISCLITPCSCESMQIPPDKGKIHILF